VPASCRQFQTSILSIALLVCEGWELAWQLDPCTRRRLEDWVAVVAHVQQPVSWLLVLDPV